MHTSKPVALRAKFRNLKLTMFGRPEVVQCEMLIDIVPVNVSSGLYEIQYALNHRPASGRRFTLLTAKEKVRMMFQEQLTEWVPIGQGATADAV